MWLPKTAWEIYVKIPTLQSKSGYGFLLPPSESESIQVAMVRAPILSTPTLKFVQGGQSAESARCDPRLLAPAKWASRKGILCRSSFFFYAGIWFLWLFNPTGIVPALSFWVSAVGQHQIKRVQTLRTLSKLGSRAFISALGITHGRIVFSWGRWEDSMSWAKWKCLAAGKSPCSQRWFWYNDMLTPCSTSSSVLHTTLAASFVVLLLT